MSIRPGRAKQPENPETAGLAAEIAAISPSATAIVCPSPSARRIDHGDTGDIEPSVDDAARNGRALQAEPGEKPHLNSPNMNMSICSY
jgi:hypothetical protein